LFKNVFSHDLSPKRHDISALSAQLPIYLYELTRVLIHAVGGITHIGQSEASDQRRPPRLHYSGVRGEAPAAKRFCRI